MYIVAFVNFTLELFLITLAKLAKELYLKSQRGRQYQMEKLHAELQFLRTQLNPHFLFNTLNNIYALVTTKSDKAGDSILLLSNLLHYLLYETNADKVKLSNELTVAGTGGVVIPVPPTG
ncbi:histidine kinase [Ostertagia ostertagi]